MKITLLTIALFVLSGFAGDSGLYSYSSNGTNDIAGMTEHIQKLRTLIEYNAEIESYLNRKIEVQALRIRILERLIEKTKKAVN